jgi:hypothetical protein
MQSSTSSRSRQYPARRNAVRFLWSLVLLGLAFESTCRGLSAILDGKHLKVAIDPSGAYQIVDTPANWTLAGQLPGPVTGIKVAAGTDAVGKYQQLAFAWKDGERDLTGSIRLYEIGDLLLFADTLTQASATPASAFPDFTSVPAGWFDFSYRNSAFSGPQFDLGTTFSPWLFFDAQDHALILSAATHFTIATMTGDGKSRVSSAFSPTLEHLPAGFTQQTLLAFGDGINATYELWGHALTGLQGKERPANDADPVLKYYGYWTDNGAAYWYNYDLSKGYQATLQQVVDTYRQEKIPLRYLQLDSWWYHKTLTTAEGKPGREKNSKLPAGDWNRYGGTTDYTASTAVFPEGLAAFHQQADMPFIVHNRWIDPTSPYHQRYKISGIAAVDPGFWKEIAAYLKSSGVIAYEQDWLSSIFANSPELSSTPDLGDAFLDGMASAFGGQGLSVQYCMAPPRCFLQASKYGNVTTIRTSNDHFIAARYHDFLYTSRFASALGIWPWSDVFGSGETNSLLISNLSAGPVGTGDALGKEDRTSLLRAMRADGVIIKPDTAIVPVDSAYIAEAQEQTVPLVSTAWTDHHGYKTVYAAVIDPPKASGSPFTLSAADLGIQGTVCVYDYLAANARWLEKDQPYMGRVAPGGLSYLIASPAGASGIAFLGDGGKFVSMGRQRIRSVDDQPGHLTAEVLLSSGEDAVTLHGYCRRKPMVTVLGGTAGPISYDASTGHFSVEVRPGQSATSSAEADPVRQLEVTFKGEAQ